MSDAEDRLKKINDALRYVESASGFTRFGRAELEAWHSAMDVSKHISAFFPVTASESIKQLLSISSTQNQHVLEAARQISEAVKQAQGPLVQLAASIAQSQGEAAKVAEAMQSAMNPALLAFSSGSYWSKLKELQGFNSGWLEQQKSSVLFQFLSAGSLDEAEASNLSRVEFDANIVDFAGGVGVSEWTEPALENEIVTSLEAGSRVSDLSSKAQEYLVKYWKWMVTILVFTYYAIDVCQKIEWVDSKLSGVTDSSQVHQVVKELPHEYKDLLSEHRFIIREGAILRCEPDKRSRELGRLKLGTRVEVLSADHDRWIHVIVEVCEEETEGWLYRPNTIGI
ncbi:hypothetical protein D3C84_184540 [compost metagenome]|uniref:SH3 domain-containing protein n=1 Tax=Pseudomonas sp. ACN8 TaxID=1920428 RepID=UPI000BB36D46|nr:SH3 domain-containing protein [Pseudomonas sp. ACN8]PBJ21079.1 hypothetical protein BSF44_37660 [Pseudomonas sp. ACN8]